MAVIRAFIAVTLPPEVRHFLTDLQRKVRQAADVPVKWVETENLHLTLAFLGNVDETKTPDISKIMHTAAAGAQPLTLKVAGLGVFPNPRRPRIVWAGLTGDVPELQRLQWAVAEGLATLGFPRDDKPFRPHLTLGRVRDSASSVQSETLGRAVAGLAATGERSFSVADVHLIKSQLTGSGPIYTVIGSAKLG